MWVSEESYLIPMLIRWLNSEDSINSKIILVPSRSDNCQVNRRIYEFALTLNFDENTVNKIINLGNTVESRLEDLNVLKAFFPEAIKFKKYTNLSYETVLKKKIDIQNLPQQSLANFVNIQDGFREFLNEYGGIILPAHFTIFPWIKSTISEYKCAIIEEHIKNYYEKDDNEK